MAGAIAGPQATAAQTADSAPRGAEPNPLIREIQTGYPDHRPTRYRLEAKDQGVVFRHGTGPGQCDYLGARNVWVYESDGTYYMHYDGAGPKGWLCCLATSKDLLNWTPKGPVLNFGTRARRIPPRRPTA